MNILQDDTEMKISDAYASIRLGKDFAYISCACMAYKIILHSLQLHTPAAIN